MRSYLKVAGIAALAGGLLLAQNAVSNHPHAGRQGGQAHGSQAMLERLSTKLNLTADQKQQAQSIFSAARESGKQVEMQLRQDRQALTAATHANNQAEIDRLTASMGPLMAQASAIHSKAFAKFYATLTPDQQAQMGQARHSRGRRGGPAPASE